MPKRNEMIKAIANFAMAFLYAFVLRYPTRRAFSANSRGVRPVRDLKTLQKYEALANPTSTAISSTEPVAFTNFSLDFSTRYC